MKYSSEDLENMSYSIWMESIAQELNAAGYTTKGFKKEGKLIVPGNVPYEVYDINTFFEGSINDPNAMDYLKSIGLVNNKRCPLCGSIIKGSPSQYTYSLNPSLNYHICSSCRKEGQNYTIHTNPIKSSGCIVAIFLIPWHIIKYFFIGVIR